MDELIDRKKLSAVMTEVGLDMTRGAGTAPTSSLYFQPVTNGHTETPSRLSRVLPRTLAGKNPCYVPWRQWVGKKTWPLAAGPAPTPHKQPHYCRDTTLPPPYFNTFVRLSHRWCLDKIGQKHAKCMIKVRYFRLFFSFHCFRI